jgi:hypothetical protein
MNSKESNRERLFSAENEAIVVATVADRDLLQTLARERAMCSARTKRGCVLSTTLRENPHLGWNPTEASW